MTLSEKAKETFAKLGSQNLLIGIPSYNNKETIGFVIEQAVKGAKNFNKDLKIVVFNSDGGSTDGTPMEVEKVGKKLDAPIFSFPYEGIKGKGSSLFAIIEQE